MSRIRDFTIGPTGTHPRGKIADDDDGELTVALAVDRAEGVVRIAFGTSVSWIGLPAEDARALAQMLVEMAEALEKGTH